jgi:acetyl-CoA carboxylase biotin carboxylase subunit
VKVLIANRGEIAVRIMRACRELRLPTVAVYSNSDRTAPHVRAADEAIGLEADAPGETYLRIDKLIDAAHRSRAEAIHPGYGFLAENAGFAQACQEAGLRWVGPAASVIALMGGKTAARQAAQDAGVPIVPGTESPLGDGMTDAEIAEIAVTVGYPLFVKAVAGGGGKGMRLVRAASELVGAVQAARSEAGSSFGDPSVYLERSVSPARHIEIQVLGDEHGRVVPFVERECSIQRRHQKVLEETPSLAVSAETRLALTSAATALAERVGYTSAGTVEFLLDSEERFYFLEMNTRLQVEHPVTEMVTGVDLVQWQLRIARGERLTIDADLMLEPRGHAIECRVYAEDPDAGFLPSPGQIDYLRRPAGPGIRDDSGVEEGFEIPVFYDSMISKLIVWGNNRSDAVARLERALAEYEVGGVKTTLPFFRWLLQRPEFVSGRFDTGFLDAVLADQSRTAFSDPSADVEERAVLATALRTYLRAEKARSEAADSAVTGWRRAARAEALG